MKKRQKKYGILYTALIDKNIPDNDGIVDIMVRSEDASKVNRVVERFKLAQTDNITIRNEIEKDKMEEMMKEAKEKKVFLLFLMRKKTC
ncbi:MAG: PcfB family protein [Clostridium sp.]|nr:MAG: PcfB family protein [Clostridium sp.]